MVLILDGLNQLEDRDNAPDLGWLPEYFPPNIRVLLSTLPGRPLRAIQNRKWPTYEVKGLTPDKIRQFVPEYLRLYRKTLDRPHLEKLVKAPQCMNPLYLRALLEELRVFGVHEQLEGRISHYLEAPTVPELYEKILLRLEEDYEKGRPGLVGG